MPFLPSLVGGGRRTSPGDFRIRVLPARAPQPPLPLLARMADAGAVVLCLVALAIAASGGFRERHGDIRLIVTSWQRIAAAALALIALRHAWRPAPALPVRLWAGVRVGWASPVVRTAVAAAVATRLTVIIAGYFASVIIAPVPGSVRFRVGTDTLSNLSAKWDAGWYLTIVEKGYQWDGNRREQQNVVFFPALPMAMYASGLLLGKKWLAGGVLVSLGAFAWALAYLFRLAREQLGGESGVSAVWLLATYPFAVYFSAPYTESLYLLATVAAVYHATRRESAAAAGWGLLAGLCRPNGFLLAVPLAMLLLGPAFVRWLRERPRRPEDPPVRMMDFAAVAAPIAALGLYSAYLWWQFGEPLAWQQGQLAWGRRYVGLWKGTAALFTQRYNIIGHMGLMGYARVQPMDFLNTCAALFVVISLVPISRRLGLAYAVLVAVNLFPPLIVGGMMSIGRMTSVMFPVFVWLGSVVRPSRLPAWTAAFAVLQGLVAALFYTWRPAF